MKDNLKIIKNNEHYNPYVLNIVLEISLKHFSCECEILEIVDVNSFYSNILVKVNGHAIYIKYSKDNSFINKDYKINWILQNLNITLQPIDIGFLESKKIYYTILKAEESFSLKENFNNTRETKLIITNILNEFHSLPIDANDEIPSFENILKLKFKFINIISFIKQSDIESFNEIAACYASVYEEMIYIFNAKDIKNEQIKLIHGNLNEFNILLNEDSFVLKNFEFCCWANPIVEECIFYINLNVDKKNFLTLLNIQDEERLQEYSYYYDLCLMRKLLDFIVNIMYCYIIPENKYKATHLTNTLKINLFSNIKEFNLLYPALLNFINHSSV